MLYFRGTSTGKGFITHEDKANFEAQIYGNIFVTSENSDAKAWATRNGLESITKEAAQAIFDAAVEAYAIEWDNLPAEDKEEPPFDERPETIPLP